MEISPLICSANQWTGFCMIGTSAVIEYTNADLKIYRYVCLHIKISCLKTA